MEMTKGQLKKIWVEARALGIDAELLHEWLWWRWRKHSLKDLSKGQAIEVIDLLVNFRERGKTFNNVDEMLWEEIRIYTDFHGISWEELTDFAVRKFDKIAVEDLNRDERVQLIKFLYKISS